MFSSSIALKTHTMRPGPLSGCYPEQGDRETGWIDRSFSALQGMLARLGIDRQAGLRKVAAGIGSHGDALTALDSTQFDQLLIDLRRRFRRQGLCYPVNCWRPPV